MLHTVLSGSLYQSMGPLQNAVSRRLAKRWNLPEHSRTLTFSTFFFPSPAQLFSQGSVSFVVLAS